MALSPSALTAQELLHLDRAEASAAQVMVCRGTWLWPSTRKQEIPVTKVSAATLQEDSGPDAGWQVRVSCSGICQHPAEQDNSSQGYGIFHCKHNPEISL